MSSVSNIRDQIKIIQQLANTELCINLAKEDRMKYIEYMRELYPDFSKEYFVLFKKVVLREDLSMLEPMLKSIDDLNNGLVQEKDITTNIGETLAEKYLYPVLGKPESTTENQPQFITK